MNSSDAPVVNKITVPSDGHLYRAIDELKERMSERMDDIVGRLDRMERDRQDVVTRREFEAERKLIDERLQNQADRLADLKNREAENKVRNRFWIATSIPALSFVSAWVMRLIG